MLLAPSASASLYFYPRSPCGERQFLRGIYHFTNDISIHALLAESDRLTLKQLALSQ